MGSEWKAGKSLRRRFNLAIKGELFYTLFLEL
jgi:hypothetical protein